MKFSCSSFELQKALQLVSRAISGQQALPILNNILIQVEDSMCTISATDLEISIISKFPVEEAEDGSITVPAKAILNFAQHTSDPSVTIEVVNATQIKCTSQKAKTIISGEVAKDFPTISTVSSEQVIKLPAAQLFDVLQKVTFAAAKNTLRPVLSGVLFTIKDNMLIVVATDSYRLSECKIPYTTDIQELQCIIPVKVLDELKNAISVFLKSNTSEDQKSEDINDQKSPEVVITINAQQVSFSIEKTCLVSRLIDGKFPNYQQIIPKEQKATAGISTQELSSVIKRMHYFAKETNNNITCSIGNAAIHMTTSQTQYGQDEATISAELTGEEVKIALSSLYLLDFLSHIRSDAVTMKLNDSVHPAVFTLPGSTDFLHLIMPLRLQ